MAAKKYANEMRQHSSRRSDAIGLQIHLKEDAAPELGSAKNHLKTFFLKEQHVGYFFTQDILH